MRTINVLLCFVVSAIIALLVLEVGFRVLGMGPQPTINRFDPVTGWSKTPNAHGERKTSEFHVTYDINALGLRDDPMDSPAKPAGTFRVLVLGDSFVLGYTVDREDLFVDLLENRWKKEGRAIDVINAGTEGFSTDQEVAWFEAHGAEFKPDVVVLVPYENDLYWNSQTHYRRFPKPRYTAFGDREKIVMQDPGPRSWFERFALGTMWTAGHEPHVAWSVDGVHRLDMEHAAYFRDPPEFMKDAIGRTRGALTALKAHCKALEAQLVVAPIPGKGAIETNARKLLEAALNPRLPGERLTFWKDHPKLPADSWSPDQPVETFLGLCQELSIPSLDARAALKQAARATSEEVAQYYQSDWHLNPQGNRTFAAFLHDQLDATHVIPATLAAKQPAEMPPAVVAGSKWYYYFAGLWLVLSTAYALTYRDEPYWKAALGVAGMLGLVFAIAIGGGKLLKLLPPQFAQIAAIVVVTTILVFVLVKLGRRLGTIAELFVAFTRRGHWYLMPLVVVLLTVGSLLVVAASSPLVAPFIYTLF